MAEIARHYLALTRDHFFHALKKKEDPKFTYGNSSMEYKEFFLQFLEKIVDKKILGGFEAEIAIKGRYVRYTVLACWLRKRISILSHKFFLKILKCEVGELQDKTEIKIIRWLGKREILKILSENVNVDTGKVESSYGDVINQILLYKKIKRLFGVDLLREDKVFKIYEIIERIPLAIVSDPYIDDDFKYHFKGVLFLLIKGENIFVCTKDFFDKYIEDKLNKITVEDLKRLAVLCKIKGDKELDLYSPGKIATLKKSYFIREIVEEEGKPSQEVLNYIFRLIK